MPPWKLFTHGWFVWLKLAQEWRERFLIFVNVFLFCLTIFLRKLNSCHPKMLCPNLIKICLLVIEQMDLLNLKFTHNHSYTCNDRRVDDVRSDFQLRWASKSLIGHVIIHYTIHYYCVLRSLTIHPFQRSEKHLIDLHTLVKRAHLSTYSITLFLYDTL